MLFQIWDRFAQENIILQSNVENELLQMDLDQQSELSCTNDETQNQ